MSDGESTPTDEAEQERTTTAESEAEGEAESEAEGEAESEAETAVETTIDIEAVEEREATVEELREIVDDQQARIEELEDLMLDMSARAAHDGGTGVCPDCHGPVVKISRWFRSPNIKCTQCGRVFHEY
jgi:hypothetical protein